MRHTDKLHTYNRAYTVNDYLLTSSNPPCISLSDGKYKALVMEFDLAPSSYATMVLREILKSNTSSSAQARMNDYHESPTPKKIIIESNSTDNDDKSETCDVIQSGSLLSNAEKYEEFKNSIFKSIEVPEKRKNEEEVEGSNKKQKTENGEQVRIIMETPLL